MYQPDFVFYHKDCADGMASLVAFERAVNHAYRAFPVQYKKPFPIAYEELNGKSVLFVDFFPDEKDWPHLRSRCEQIVIVDHHKTSKERAADLPKFDGSMADLMELIRLEDVVCHFDMEKSGARLTWELYHGIERAPPMLIQYVEDRDLWKWRLSHSHEINAWIGSFDIEPAIYHAMLYDLEDRVVEIVREGKAIIRSRDRVVGQIAESATRAKMLVGPSPEGQTVDVLLVWSSVLQSEVGNVLAPQSPSGIAAIAYPIDGDNRLKISMRSTRDVDITPILKNWGGGGHAQAGGFETTLEFPNPFEVIDAR